MCERIYVKAADLHHFKPYLNEFKPQIDLVEVGLASNTYERPDGLDAMNVSLIINEGSTPIGIGQIVMGMIELVETVETGCKSCTPVLVTHEVKTIIANLIQLPIRLENA